MSSFAAAGKLWCLVCALGLWAPGNCLALEDPTRPPDFRDGGARPAAGEQQERWRLQSTLTGHGRSVAVINGRMVTDGQEINGAQVVRIEPGRVVLTVSGQEEVTLTVLPTMLMKTNRLDNMP